MQSKSIERNRIGDFSKRSQTRLKRLSISLSSRAPCRSFIFGGNGNNGNGNGRLKNTGFGRDDDSNEGSSSPIFHHSAVVFSIAVSLLVSAPILIVPPAAIAAKKEAVSHILSEGQINEMFKMLSMNPSGKISLESLLEAVRNGKLGLLHSESGCRAFMTKADLNKDGLISSKEFHSYVKKREAELIKLFSEIDKDGDGRLSTSELQKYMERALSKKVSLDDASMLMRKIDSDKSGSVEAKELLLATMYESASFAEAFESWRDHVYHLFFPRQVVRRSNTQ